VDFRIMVVTGMVICRRTLTTAAVKEETEKAA